MWKVVTGLTAAAAMLTLGGVARAGDKPMENTDTSTTGVELEQQSGMEKEHSFDVKSLRGQQAMKLQESLKAQGLYHGKIDGRVGPLTIEALRKFQEQKGFGATGKLDQKTAAALGIETSDIQPVSGSETETGVDPAASPTPMTNSGSTTTEPDSGVDKAGEAGRSGTDETDPQSGADDATGDDAAIEDDATLPEGSDASDTATGTGSMNSDVEGTTDDARDPQSGSDTSTTGDGTTPVTGGGTANEETESTSGDSGAPMGGVDTDEDANVVEESEIEPQAGTSSTFDKKTIRKVEQALKDKKLFNGKVDGVIDDKTTQAIRAFQSQQGLAANGTLDVKTLDALGVKSKTNIDVNTDTNTDPQSGTNETMTPTPIPNETPVSTPLEPTHPNPGMDPPR